MLAHEVCVFLISLIMISIKHFYFTFLILQGIQLTFMITLQLNSYHICVWYY